ncbi:MAG: hypothetical protein NDI60_10435 [Elusimicrobiales bacterium]|nr:hypothetical protein [Elusimicrobiales bacterium]
MIQRCIQEAYRLTGKSGKEAALYAAVAVFNAWLYVLVCGFLGVHGVYGGGEEVGISLRGGLLAHLPGLAVAAWFAAGLTGRFTLHAAGGEAQAMPAYAGRWWFFRAGWDIVFSLIIWLAIPILKAKFWGATIIGIMWMITCLWLALRVSLWLNAAIGEGLGFRAGMKRSYELTRDRLWTLLLLGAILMGALKVLAWPLGKFIPNPAVVYYLDALLQGVGAVLVMAASAAFYTIVKAEGPAAPAGEGGAFWGKTE